MLAPHGYYLPLNIIYIHASFLYPTRESNKYTASWVNLLSLSQNKNPTTTFKYHTQTSRLDVAT